MDHESTTILDVGDRIMISSTLEIPIDQPAQAQEWIEKNIIQVAQSQDKFWRVNYLNRLGISHENDFTAKSKSLPVGDQSKSSTDNARTSNLELEKSYIDESGIFLLNFLTRTHTDVRNNYIQKLKSNGILQNGPSKKQQTFTIFDWDDTLLCTTYLGSYGFIDLPAEVIDQLSSLNVSGARLLQKAANNGDTFIITNAAQGWVEYSSRLYMPKVHEVIIDNKIVVISARHGYEDSFPGDCSKWKVEAFKDIKRHFDNNLITNILCLGDSHIEIDAAHVLAKEFSYPIIKTVKFRENPKPDELVKQQDLVSEKFEQIYNSLKNLTIRLEKYHQYIHYFKKGDQLLNRSDIYFLLDIFKIQLMMLLNSGQQFQPQLGGSMTQETQQHIFQLPYNKTQIFLVFGVQFMLDQIQILNGLPITEVRKFITIWQMKCDATDGQEWNIEITLQIMSETIVQFYFEFSSIGLLDDTKGYKLLTTLLSKGIKKRKDTKKSFDQKQKSCGYGINLALNDLLANPICLEIEITVETTSKYNSREEVGFTGLINTSSLCYMNSVFQILFHLCHFRRLIFQIQDITDRQEFPATLQNLFFNMMTQKTSVSTQEIIRSFKWDSEQQTIQHDVHEFTMELLKGIEHRLEKQKDLAKQIIGLFEGQLENHIQGIEKKFDNIIVEEFMDIQLHVEGCQDIESSFQLFAQKELLNGDNAIQTDHFGKQSAYKFHLFKTLPPVLFLNLKRYRYNSDVSGLEKINDRFVYSDMIQLKSYMAKKSASQQCRYRLYGVLVHRGELIHHGHYYCFLKQDNEWFKFDDRLVTKATTKQVFENNFGGSYETGEYDQEAGQLNLNKQQNPETAYMLVYVDESKMGELLMPIENKDIPIWIQEKETEQSKKIEMKNYNQIQVITFAQLNKFHYTDKSLRNGLCYHKNAPNSIIDLDKLNQMFSEHSIVINFPKNFTNLQTYEYLANLLKIDQETMKLYLYKIIHNQPDHEQLQLIDYTKKKSMHKLFNKKNLFSALIINSTEQRQQVQLEAMFENLFITDRNIEFQDQSKNQITLMDEEVTELSCVLIKEFIRGHNPIINFSNFVMVPLDMTLNQLIKTCFTQVNPQGNSTFTFQSNFDLIELSNMNQTVKDLLHEFKSSFLTVLIDVDNQIHPSSIQWARQISVTREVYFRNQSTNQEFQHIFNKDDNYWSLVKVIGEYENYVTKLFIPQPQNHIILKHKDKKGVFVLMKVPSEEQFEFQGSSVHKKIKQNHPNLQTVEQIIQNDISIVYKYSPISVYELKTQFAINYDVYLRNGETISFQNVICSKETLIDDLQQQALYKQHLVQLQNDNNGDESKIIPLIIKKKALLDISLASSCQNSLAKLKIQYFIAFVNKIDINEEGELTTIVKLLSQESELITTPIVFCSHKSISTLGLLSEVWKFLSDRKIKYFEEIYDMSEDEIVITQLDGKQRKFRKDLTIFLSFDDQEKILTLEEKLQPIDELTNLKKLVIDLSVMFNSVTNSRHQRLRQQGVCLNL